MEHKNIYEAILGVMDEIAYVQKDGHMQGANYTYASEAAFINAIRPKLIEHGIIVYPAGSSSANFELSNYATKNGGSMNALLIRQGYKFVHAPSSTEIYVQTFGLGADSGDKAAGKAMTNAFKYALRQTFVIETGDDPDYTSSEEQARASEQDMYVERELAKLEPTAYPDNHMTQSEKDNWLKIVKQELYKGEILTNAVLTADERYRAYKEKQNE